MTGVQRQRRLRAVLNGRPSRLLRSGAAAAVARTGAGGAVGMCPAATCWGRHSWCWVASWQPPQPCALSSAVVPATGARGGCAWAVVSCSLAQVPAQQYRGPKLPNVMPASIPHAALFAATPGAAPMLYTGQDSALASRLMAAMWARPTSIYDAVGLCEGLFPCWRQARALVPLRKVIVAAVSSARRLDAQPCSLVTALRCRLCQLTWGLRPAASTSAVPTSGCARARLSPPPSASGWAGRQPARLSTQDCMQPADPSSHACIARAACRPLPAGDL